jgi:crotonobetainyl-CoA:carnitine CoA-transferase CaiB-like acyl-CoA transferase
VEKKGPLVGITVLDWTQWQMGPVATAMLADLGADVIHIEHHITGDPGRGLNASDTAEFVKGKHSYFEVNNRGKKSITINLQIDEGKEILYRLIEKADVFVHNFRQGVPERLKVDYNTLKKYNPRLIYAAAYGILAALIARERYGVGQKVDSSLLMSMITWQGLMLGKALYLNKPAVRQDRKKPRNVLWNFYKCKDEKWIVLAMLQSQRYWPEVCKALGSEYLINNPRFRDDLLREKNSQELVLILDGIFEQKTADEWNKILHDGYDIISTPVQSLNDLPEDPQVIANEYVINYNHESIGPVKIVGLPVALSKTPGKVIAEAPEFGQHTEEVLIELGGYTWEDITALRRKKAI